MKASLTAALLILSVGLSLGCNDSSTTEPDQSEGDASSTSTDDSGSTAPGTVRWHIAVDGMDLPTEEGSTVMSSDQPGGIAKYSFTNARVMASVSLRDVAVGETGEWRPYSLNVSYIDAQMTCGMSSINEDHDLTVKISETADGVRGEFEGDVTCAETDGDAREMVTMDGWFEK
jgi:hypothetical protein